MFMGGRYGECITAARAAIEDGEYAEDWRLLLTESYLARGEYTNALEVVTAALDRYSRSIRVCLLARTVFLFNDQPSRARSMVSHVNYLATSRMWAYNDPVNMVALGQAALLMGADSRKVLEQFFDRAKRERPELRDVYLASGQLALDKEDFKLAAKVFQEGLKKLPEDPDLHYGLARSFAPSDRRQMTLSIASALKFNTNHAGCYLLLADHLIDSEEYEAAESHLALALEVNPWNPEAWACRAVLAHLENDSDGEAHARRTALRHWPSNPHVDYLIGKKLSQKYRFDEGAICQRRALRNDPDFLPSKIQLAQDLMRLGEEAEGWKLAREVNEADAYDVTAFNLVTLKEGLDKFQTLTNADFILRMGAKEAAVYGPEALELLQQAKDRLCAKYGMTLSRPTIVEIFPDQRDFGVRTFGMPHNPGFLGVCFGSVITANSPASQGGHPNNWQAVLWHEFCHVVTLQMTKNKMPRWLSEGISVYEELQANPAWGQIMNPSYRAMILDGELTPVHELSAAFLTAESDLHMQFAYYQSCLVVEFLVGRYGLDSLKQILVDLGQGVEINEAIASHTAPMETIETEFVEYAKAKAEALGPGLEWEKPDPDELGQALAGETPEWLEKHSKNYYVLMQRARRWIEAKDWDQAKTALQTLIERYPDQVGTGNAYSLLALVHQNLDEHDQERAVLKRLALQDADAVEAYARLMVLAEEDGDWPSVLENAKRYLAVNPMILSPHLFMARMAEKLDRASVAMRAWENALHLETLDPVEAHFHLAKLMRHTGPAEARMHVLKALEEAPRFREAQALLLELPRAPGPSAVPAPSRLPTPAPVPGTVPPPAKPPGFE